MNKAERDRRLREIAVELKRIREIPIRELSAGSGATTQNLDTHDDAVHNLIMARNFLRAIKSPS